MTELISQPVLSRKKTLIKKVMRLKVKNVRKISKNDIKLFFTSTFKVVLFSGDLFCNKELRAIIVGEVVVLGK